MNAPNDLSKDQEERIGLIERMKDVQKLQSDYFKNLTLLGSTALLISFAFHDRISADFPCWQKAAYLAALIIFFIMIILCLSAMKNAGNIVLYCNGLQIAIHENKEQDAINFQLKTDSALNDISAIDKITNVLYVVGLSIILILTAFMIFK